MPREVGNVFGNILGRVRVMIKIYGIDEEHEAEVVEVDFNGKPTSVFVTDSLVWRKLNIDDFELISEISNPNEVIN